MKIRKRIIPDLDRWLLPLKPVVPLMNTIHDRITLEIARGCTRGCRFCQAGMVWRPVRERNPSTLLTMAEEALKATGYDEITLLSLSSGDYSRIEPLLKELMDRYCERRVALGLPSLRVETLSPSLIEQIRKVRKTSFTIAPEAGTRRLRAIINKGNTEEDLIATARRVYEGGWKVHQALLHDRPARRAGRGPGGDCRPGAPCHEGGARTAGHPRPFDPGPQAPHALPVGPPDRPRGDPGEAGPSQAAPEEPQHQLQVARCPDEPPGGDLLEGR